MGGSGSIEPGHRSASPIERRVRIVAGVGLFVLIGGAAIATRVGIGADPPSSGPVAPSVDRAVRTARASEVGGIRFVDVTQEAGLPTGGAAEGRSGSAGVAVADVDADGWPDLYLTNVDAPNQLMRNRHDGTFEDIAAAAGVAGADPGNGSLAAAFADVDGDGCQDLYVTAAGRGRNVLYRSTCDGRFRDATAGSGLAMPVADGPFGNQQNQVAAADYDHDGDLDVFVPSWYAPALLDPTTTRSSDPPPDRPETECERETRTRGEWWTTAQSRRASRTRLFSNDGSGHFVDATHTPGLTLARSMAVTGTFADIDRDGRDDLLVAGDLCTTRVYRNLGSKGFADVTDELGLGLGQSDMGSTLRDLNGDGDLDWFVTDISALDGSCGSTSKAGDCMGNRLYLSDGRGGFRDRGRAAGVSHGWFGWGAVIADFANDGRLSIPQVASFDDDIARQLGVPATEIDRFGTYGDRGSRFWLPLDQRGGRYADAAGLVGLGDLRSAQSLVPLDYDRDGRVDLLARDIDGTTHLLRNATRGAGHWLDISLHDPGSRGNPQGIGATVRVWPTRTTQRPVVQRIATEGSFASQVLPEVHVGLGSTSKVARIAVRWPGCEHEQVLRDVEVDQALVVTRRC